MAAARQPTAAKSWSLFEAMGDADNEAEVARFKTFSAAMVVVPLGTLYGALALLPKNGKEMMIGGLAAVFAVQLVIGGYVVHALRQNRLDFPEGGAAVKKQD